MPIIGRGGSNPLLGMMDGRAGTGSIELAFQLERPGWDVPVEASRLGRPGSIIRASPTEHAPVAQLDRVPDYGSGGWGFESSRAHF